MYQNKTIKKPEKTRQKHDGVKLSNKNTQLNIKEIEEMEAPPASAAPPRR